MIKTLLATFGIWMSISILNAQDIEVLPAVFEEGDQVRIKVTNFDPQTAWSVSDIYFWAWYFDLSGNFVDSAQNQGDWTDSNDNFKFSQDADGSFSFVFTPKDLFQTTGIGKIGFLLKADDGNLGQSENTIISLGLFQSELTSPSDTLSVLDFGDTLPVAATSTVPSDFELYANGMLYAKEEQLTAFQVNYSLLQNTDFELVVTQSGSTTKVIHQFSAIIKPTPAIRPLPQGMQDGLTHDPNVLGTATFVLFAPQKEFVYLKGNFNDWKLDSRFLMHKDPDSDRFWIKIEDLPTNTDILYQYDVEAKISIADPYSRLILSPYNDQFIETETFADIPAYPEGKTKHALSWFRIDQEEGQYSQLSSTTHYNFTRPKAEDLVIYELLIRDFDARHTFDSVIQRLDYLQDLGINAIELLPVSEFDGNLSWGYNPSFHMALDKYYGTAAAFKSFVDACHLRGIAVILDVVYNHGTGQHPYFRMWNDCNGCYTGKATSQNPFFNSKDPNTSFSFFNDFDHQSQATQAYMDRINAYWLQEFRIDGFRFDFTKGFTNTMGDGSAYDQSRIDLLKRMKKAIDAIDPEAYVVLEHFAENVEETELKNAGMLLWGNMNYSYNQATMGYDNSNLYGASYQSRGWNTPALISYMESHDEERLMYKNLAFGNASGSYAIQDLDTALDRVKLAAAFYFTIPGPKMIWQFGELGYELSINQCADQSIDESCRTDPKPIPWNYLEQPNRRKLYDFYAKLIRLKRVEKIFSTKNFTISQQSDSQKRIQLTDDLATEAEIKHITIIGNFGVTNTQIIPNFQKTGVWYDLLSTEQEYLVVDDVEAPLQLAPGEFKIYANQQSLLHINKPTSNPKPKITAYPNPAQTRFKLSKPVEDISLYTIAGKKIQDYSSNNTNTYDVSQLPAGLYLLKLRNGDAISFQRLVKKE